jgi:hypothetical protein
MCENLGVTEYVKFEFISMATHWQEHYWKLQGN